MWGAGKAEISYIIPAFNCATTIRAAVNSIVMGNLGSGDEIVIVDDGSTDRTFEILCDLKATTRNIQVIRHDRNRGGGVARNTAVEAASRDLIFCLDSDNLLVPGSVPTLANFLRAERADVAAFGGLTYFRADSRITSSNWVYKSGEIRFADMMCGHINPASSGNYLFTHDSWKRAGGYPDSAGALDTWGFGLRQVGSGAKMLTMPMSCYLHRVGHESYWVRWSRQGGQAASDVALKILSPYIDLLSNDARTRIASEERWFDLLGEYPLQVASGEKGVDGRVVRTLSQSLLKPYERFLWHRAKRKRRRSMA